MANLIIIMRSLTNISKRFNTLEFMDIPIQQWNFTN